MIIYDPEDERQKYLLNLSEEELTKKYIDGSISKSEFYLGTSLLFRYFQNSNPNDYPKDNWGFLYIIENKDNTIKIGRSKEPEKRIKVLEIQANLILKNKYISEKITKCAKLENTLHKKFETNRLKGEWFNVPFTEAVLELKKLIPFS